MPFTSGAGRAQTGISKTSLGRGAGGLGASRSVDPAVTLRQRPGRSFRSPWLAYTESGTQGGGAPRRRGALGGASRLSGGHGAGQVRDILKGLSAEESPGVGLADSDAKSLEVARKNNAGIPTAGDSVSPCKSL